MSKKELTIFVCAALLPALLLCTVFVWEMTGHASLLVKDFTADADGTVYLLTENQVRILSADHSLTSFRPGVQALEYIETDGETISLFFGDRVARYDHEGHELARGPVEEHPDWYLIAKKPVTRGDTTYSFRSLFGFYRIIKQTGSETVVWYRIPTGDALLRVMLLAACLLLFAAGLGFPLYFLKNKRFTKDGRILPKPNRGTEST